MEDMNKPEDLMKTFNTMKDEAEKIVKDTTRTIQEEAGPVKERIIEKTTVLKEVPATRGINRIIYILLVLFFGMWGVHRFYAGHGFAGCCYLVTFLIGSLLTGFFGIGIPILFVEVLFCLYDLVKALFATEDAEGKVHL